MRATRSATIVLLAGALWMGGHGLAAGLESASVKFKTRGYFIAHVPKRLDRQVPAGKISLIAYPDKSAAFGSNKGFMVILANSSGVDADFEAQDSRINVIREAMDRQGRWRPIEYLPNSWCGNSYHRVYLPPNRYWVFTAPEYSGPFSTRMRFVLEQPGFRIVSNEFRGSINVEQFDRKQGHTPTNIMDPYND